MTFLKQIRLPLIRRRAYLATCAELETYSERELNADLGLSRSNIPDVAREAAERRVTAHLSGHPA